MTFPEINRALRGHDFYPPTLDAIPGLYATESTPLDDKIVFAKYHVRHGVGEWFVMELDHREDDVQALAFGWANLGQEELGYFDLIALESVLVERPGGAPALVVRDLSWIPRRWGEVRR